MRTTTMGFAAALLAVIAGSPAAAAPVAAQDTHLLIVSGLGGAPEYSSRFAGWSAVLMDAAAAAGVPAANVRWLAEREDVHPLANGVARVDAVGAEITRMAGRSAAGDILMIVLFGHGTARDDETRLNLPGPDLSAGDLAAMLAPLADRKIVVVNAASASGGFVAPLSGPGRVIVTATRSPGEAEATRFGGHFVAALSGVGADTDKDGRVSVLEAFEYARTEVGRSFAETGSLPTEHALLDDNGDGRGSLEPGEDGGLAARITLASPTAAIADDPELARLYAERARLEEALETLRTREGAMEAAAYQAELERLLLEIARTGRAIRDREGGGS